MGVQSGGFLYVWVFFFFFIYLVGAGRLACCLIHVQVFIPNIRIQQNEDAWDSPCPSFVDWLCYSQQHGEAGRSFALMRSKSAVVHYRLGGACSYI